MRFVALILTRTIDQSAALPRICSSDGKTSLSKVVGLDLGPMDCWSLLRTQGRGHYINVGLDLPHSASPLLAHCHCLPSNLVPAACQLPNLVCR